MYCYVNWFFGKEVKRAKEAKEKIGKAVKREKEAKRLKEKRK